MNKKYKRHLISMFETFLAVFLPTFAFMLEEAINRGEITRSIITSCALGAAIAGLRQVIKMYNEYKIKK